MEAPSADGAGTPASPVVHVLAPAPFGGLESAVRSLSRAQAAAGSDVHVGLVVTGARGAEPFDELARAPGVRIHVIEVPTRGYLRERRATEALCTRLAPRVFHTHGYRPDVVDAGVARRLGLPTVTTVHGFTGGGWRNRLYERIQVRAFRSFDAVVAVSAALAERLRAAGVPGDRIHTVPNAWAAAEAALPPDEARRRLGVAPGRFHVGFVGRLSLEKGPDVLVEALARLPDIDLVASFVGEGSMAGTLRTEAERLHLGDRVRWLGRLEGADRLLTGFDVVVLPSRTEGTPMVLLEAIQRGVPVVATAVGGVPDAVSADEALLVPPEAPDSLALAIRDVAGDPAAAAARAKRALAGRGDVAAWARAYAEVYEAAARRRRTRASGGAPRARGETRWPS